MTRNEFIDVVNSELQYFGDCYLTDRIIYAADKYAEERTSALDKIRAEIKEWYWQADKQALAKDPCVVDAMIDLFIRTIDKYKAESEG